MRQFRKGDLVTHVEHGGLAVVHDLEDEVFLCVNWIVAPASGEPWVYRWGHPEFDFRTTVDLFVRWGDGNICEG